MPETSTETDIRTRIIKSTSKLGARLFVNFNGTVFTKKGQPFKVGLGNGSSDLIGFTPKVITQEMVGKKVAVFTAIEVKKIGHRPRENQFNFLQFVELNGGIAGWATSDNEADEIIT